MAFSHFSESAYSQSNANNSLEMGALMSGKNQYGAGSGGANSSSHTMRGADHQVYLEFQVIGQSQKLTAIDPVSHVEVSVTGPANTPREHITNLALRKLQRRIAELAAKS